MRVVVPVGAAIVATRATTNAAWAAVAAGITGGGAPPRSSVVQKEQSLWLAGASASCVCTTCMNEASTSASASSIAHEPRRADRVHPKAVSIVWE